MQKLVPVTNKLQDIFSTLHSSPLLLDLPQIVVVGNQSSGKSSVLESFVGRDFLPRNKGICTRRPLILQLVSSKEAVREYGVFLHQEEKRYSDFSKIREEIINLTEKEAGKGKGVNERPIVLKVFSEKFIDLTLVDLPGITKVAVGDQPSDIEEKIRGIVKSYAEKPNTLILAVIPANVDIATSDALKIAKELDPHSKRTVGVLTKVDLMDKGESVRDILGGKVFPLRHGYVAVRNRSQSEIAQNVSVAEGLERERRFFADNALYSALAEHTGSARLAERLSRILVAHIRAFLPGLRLHVRRMSAEVEKRLRKFGADPSDGKGAKPATLLAAISKYANKFNDAIEGKEKDAIAKKELYGGARISKIFHQDFAAQVLRIDPFDQLRNEEISTAIRNAKGTKPSLFVPELSFEILSKSQIARLREPAQHCVEMVFNELQKVSLNCSAAELRRYSKLKEKIADCVGDVLRENKKPAVEMVDRIIDCELAYVNTNHPDFVGGSEAVPVALDKARRDEALRAKSLDGADAKEQRGSSQALERKSLNRQSIEIEIIKSLIASYFQIVRKNVMDSVPKAIMMFLVNKTKEDLQSKLVSAMYREEMIDDLLEEEAEVYAERARQKEMLSVLQKALKTIEGIREFKV